MRCQHIYSVVIFSHKFLNSDCINSKLLHSWLFIDLPEHHYTTQTSKFNNFCNCSSAMLNNVFKKTRHSLWLLVLLWWYLHKNTNTSITQTWPWFGVFVVIVLKNCSTFVSWPEIIGKKIVRDFKRVKIIIDSTISGLPAHLFSEYSASIQIAWIIQHRHQSSTNYKTLDAIWMSIMVRDCIKIMEIIGMLMIIILGLVTVVIIILMIMIIVVIIMLKVIVMIMTKIVLKVLGKSVGG